MLGLTVPWQFAPVNEARTHPQGREVCDRDPCPPVVGDGSGGEGRALVESRRHRAEAADSALTR